MEHIFPLVLRNSLKNFLNLRVVSFSWNYFGLLLFVINIAGNIFYDDCDYLK